MLQPGSALKSSVIAYTLKVAATSVTEVLNLHEHFELEPTNTGQGQLCTLYNGRRCEDSERVLLKKLSVEVLAKSERTPPMVRIEPSSSLVVEDAICLSARSSTCVCIPSQVRCGRQRVRSQLYGS